MKPKIGVGLYQTRDGRIANVHEVDEETARGTIEGDAYYWHADCGSWMKGTQTGVDLVTRIHEPTQHEEPLKTTIKPSTIEVRATQWTMTPMGKPVSDKRAITLSIKDDAFGEFLTIKNGDDSNGGSFRFDPDEWPVLRALIDEAVKGVRK